MNQYEKLMETIKEQESLLRTDSLTNDEALELGNYLVNYAKNKGIAMAIAIRKPSGAILFHHLMEGTNSNNQNWMRRKFNSVLLWEHSSLFAWAHQHLTGETLADHGFSQEEYVSVGGGFPLYLKNGTLAGVITVSNLPHFKDHGFIVDALAERLGVANVPEAIDPAEA